MSALPNLPWRYEAPECEEFANAEPVIFDAANNDLGAVFNKEHSTVPTTVEDAQAIARLWAASPKLLAALIHARSTMQHPDQMIDEAIEMATGEATP